MNPVIRLLLICWATLLLFSLGCDPATHPLTIEPTPEKLLGTWGLKNSPARPEGSPILPKSKDTLVRLKGSGRAEVNGVLIEEWKLINDRRPVTRWLLKTGEGSWRIDSWPQANKPDLWRVITNFGSGQEAIFEIFESSKGILELRYRPDPEMSEPFVFVKMDVRSKE